MIIRSIRYSRSAALGGGDVIRYAVSADLAPEDQADECARALAVQVHGWLHDRLTWHFAGEDAPGGRAAGRGSGSDQT